MVGDSDDDSQVTLLTDRVAMLAKDLGPFGDSTYKQRLTEFEALIKEYEVKRNCVGESQFFVNLFQGAQYWGIGKPDIIPSILQRSFLYDVRRKKEVLPQQHYLVRGYAFPGLAPASLACKFPYPSIVEMGAGGVGMLTAEEMRKLTGLGFNKCTITAIILYTLVTSRVDRAV